MDPLRPEHPDTEGVHVYLTRVEALHRLRRYADDDDHAAAMLDQPGVISAPWPGRPGERVYRGADVEELCRLLVEWDAAGRPEVEPGERDEM